jgi:hypothetical protein
MTPLSELFADHQEFHSDLQMDSFITLRSGGTKYGCYKQALRELTTRKLALIQRYADRDRLALEIEELQGARAASPESKPTKGGFTDNRSALPPKQTGRAVDTFRKRRKAIDLREKRLTLVEFDRVIDDTEREFTRFYHQAIGIRKELAADGVQFPLDRETRNRLDNEMWEHQLKCMAAVDLMTQRCLGRNTAELLQAMPRVSRHRLFAETRDPSKLVEWYFSLDPPPPLATIETQNVRKLIGCSE